jgi:hypothetical protein
MEDFRFIKKPKCSMYTEKIDDKIFPELLGHSSNSYPILTNLKWIAVSVLDVH